MSVKQLFKDLKSVPIKKKIDDDIKRGTQLGIKNTPAIFIYGLMYTGALKFDAMSPVLKKMIFEYNIGAPYDINEFKTACINKNLIPY